MESTLAMRAAVAFDGRCRSRGDAEGVRHPYGVGRFVDPAAWMGAVVQQRRADGPPPKYRPEVPQALLASDPPGSQLPSPMHPLGHQQQQHKGPFVTNNAMARRNERERKRVRLVNHGFATLRQYLPQGNSRKKLSKMETLRSAIEYIRQLQHLLDPVTSHFDPNSAHAEWQSAMTSDSASGSAMGAWEEAMGWASQRSPGSAGSSPQTSLSPDTDLIDFSSFT
ncbi:hypothetical protein JTE90_008458 [Oedothorax gibbosus]|uniref:BHLH domain-containing protein n=1 Tax=Oedothorax gibbosus TaxID=931172 RepID=A0AAV6V1P4_9ARAC|nr:hypothetical protein JTE90_008458 [Oedothorax gibbosus]